MHSENGLASNSTIRAFPALALPCPTRFCRCHLPHAKPRCVWRRWIQASPTIQRIERIGQAGLAWGRKVCSWVQWTKLEIRLASNFPRSFFVALWNLSAEQHQ